jgi:MerR family transcriptional regulator, copper efflux regulator
MLISELARKTGLSIDAIRYYEKIGLIAKRYIRREGNNYRRYAEGAIERLALVKILQSAGFTLQEIKDLVDRWDGGKLSPQEGEALLRKKMSEIEAKIAQMHRAKKTLQKILQAHAR